MQIPVQKGWFAVFFILFTLSVPFAVTFYVSTEDYRAKHSKTQAPEQPATQSSSPVRSTDQLFLVKNEKHFTSKTCLVYKGLSGKTVNMDIYILELDPDIPYPLKFNQQSVTDGIWLGDILYQVVSVKDNVLRLKVRNTYNTL